MSNNNKIDNEKELLRALEPVVSDNLKLLNQLETRKWWPAQFFEFLNGDNYSEELTKFREEARSISPELLVVLIGNTITEEALPNYASRLANLFPDRTGISDNPWALWTRGWNAEEDQHGRVLDHYLLLTGRVNMESVDKSIFSLIKNGFNQSPDIMKALFYPAFQEPATRISHLNVAKKAAKLGSETLARMCRNIAGDEHRHGVFYQTVCKELFELKPHESMIKFYDLLKDGIVMPAYLMTDGVYTKPPILFDNFAEVAVAEGIYTPLDYAKIMADLNEVFNISQRSVSGEAAQAQEALMALPSRLEKICERRMSKRPPSRTQKFDWVYESIS